MISFMETTLIVRLFVINQISFDVMPTHDDGISIHLTTIDLFLNLLIS